MLIKEYYNRVQKVLQPVARNATTGDKNAPVRRHTDLDFRSTWIENEVGEIDKG